MKGFVCIKHGWFSRPIEKSSTASKIAPLTYAHSFLSWRPQLDLNPKVRYVVVIRSDTEFWHDRPYQSVTATSTCRLTHSAPGPKHCAIMYDHVRSCTIMYDHVRPCTTMYDVRQNSRIGESFHA